MVFCLPGTRVSDVPDQVHNILKGEGDQPGIVVHIGTNDIALGQTKAMEVNPDGKSGVKPLRKTRTFTETPRRPTGPSSSRCGQIVDPEAQKQVPPGYQPAVVGLCGNQCCGPVLGGSAQRELPSMSMAALALVLRSGAGFTGRAATAGYAYAAARSFCVISGNKSGSIHQVLERGRSEVLGRPQVAASRIGAQVNLACSQHFRYFCSDENTGEGRLIYTGNLAKAVFGVKFFSYSTSIFSCCMMPYVILHSGLGIQSPALQAAFCGIIGLFTFLNPVVLHLLTRGYVIHLYHNAETDNYTAVTYNALLQQKKTIFHQKDVEVPGVSKMFTTFYANKKSMLVNPVLFWYPNDYNHLMGYDRPFSFDLDDLQK
ncbi:transmembrane protein 70, mitochondrial [Hemitrygon akajei]|uniref:transmembrane protein 70, mitochondrial n=1 Tax=Hemitrygon akajei TaxID=2704970 RepID=UPI003BFA0387